ncbi:MAG: hypothetical protein ACPGUE_22035 [Marinomonas sp.]
MNLAQDLLRKSQGHIHTMPESVMTKRKLSKLGTSNKPPSGKYVDENGNPVTSLSIAIKYRTNQKKVQDAFRLGSIKEAYEFLRTDQRKNNGKRNVYFTNEGESISSKALGAHYGVSRSKVYRTYRDNNMDYIKANAAIEAYVSAKC